MKKGADTHLFELALKNFKDSDFDDARCKAAKSYPRLGAKFTAGQVRALAEECDFDSAKLEVFHVLLPCTLNPIQLLDASDVFDFDDARSALFAMLVKANVTVTAEDRERVEQEPEPAPAPVAAAALPRTEGRGLALTPAVALILIILTAQCTFYMFAS